MKKSLLYLVIFISIATSFFPDKFYNSIIGSLSLSHFLIGYYLIVLTYYNLRNFTLSAWKIVSPLIFLFFWGVLSALWSPFPIVAGIFGIKLLFISNIFITVVILLRKQELELKEILLMARIVVIVTISGQLLGLILGVSIDVYGSDNTSAGLSDNVSAIAGQLLFTTPLILLSKRNIYQRIFLFIIFIAILMTLRRSSLISFFLIMSIIFLYSFISSKTSLRYKFKSLISSVLFVLVVILVIFSTKFGASFLNRAAELDPSQEGTASGRYNFQSGGLDYIFNRDIIGSIFGDGFGYSVIVNLENGFIPIGMHSDFLDIAIGLGLVGCIAFLLFYYRIYKESKRNIPGTPNFNSGIAFLVALGSISLFTGGFFNINTLPGYIALAYIFADMRYVLKDSNLK